MITPASIYFVRHGQSEAQVGLPSAGLGLCPLTALGRNQAQHAGTRFYHSCQRYQQAPVFLTSPYRRATETATILSEPWTKANRHERVDIEVIPAQEFAFLAPESRKGTTAKERIAPIEDYWNRNDPDYVDGPGAESLTSLFDRVADVLRALRTRQEPSVAVVSHARFMQAVLWSLLHDGAASHMSDMKRFRMFCLAVRVPNAGFMELTRMPGHPWYAGPIDDDHVPADQRTE